MILSTSPFPTSTYCCDIYPSLNNRYQLDYTQRTLEMVPNPDTSHPNTLEAARKVVKLYMKNIDKPGFCVKLDNLWRLCGYRRKDAAKNRLLNRSGKLNLVQGKDYVLRKKTAKYKGRPADDILLTNNATIRFACASESFQGSAFVKYLLKFKRMVDLQSKRNPTVDRKRKRMNRDLGLVLTKCVQRDLEYGTVDTQHNTIRDRIAKELNGCCESKNFLGIADVESTSYVIEVKPTSQFLHGFGQIMGYVHATGKIGRLHLFGGPLHPYMKEMCAENNILLTNEPDNEGERLQSNTEVVNVNCKRIKV